jgi:hypothetical protein
VGDRSGDRVDHDPAQLAAHSIGAAGLRPDREWRRICHGGLREVFGGPAG